MYVICIVYYKSKREDKVCALFTVTVTWSNLLHKPYPPYL